MPDTKHAAGFRNPHNLPTKICATCGRPFTWRKKWARTWDEVRYCSERCRTHAGDRTHSGNNTP